MKQLFTSFLLLFAIASFAQTLQENMWFTNGTVRAVQRADNTVYIAGDFTSVGMPAPYGGAVNTLDGAILRSYPRPNGAVHAVAPDGSGGWYIGGEFTQVGGQPRNRLARINSNGTLHAWNPNADGTVRAIATHTNRVYVGGSFSHIGGTARSSIAALTTTGGGVTAWNPNVNGAVYAIAVPSTGNTVYIAGRFSYIGEQRRRAIGAIDQTTGAPTAWNPDASQDDGIFSAPVYALAVEGDIVYAGGGFQRIGGLQRVGLAALNKTTGLAYETWQRNVQVWNPEGDPTPVRTLTVAPGAGGIHTLYVGGEFGGMGTGRNRLCAVATAPGGIGPIASLLDWRPNANRPVYTLQVVGSTLYVGGDFSEIGGQSRSYIAALDRTGTGEATSWIADANGPVNALAVEGEVLYAGGIFSTIGMRLRSGLAALNATSGVLTNWNSSLSGFDHSFYALEVDGTTVYVAGRYKVDGGDPLFPPIDRAIIVAWNRNNATIRWSRSQNAFLGAEAFHALSLDGSTLYAAGNFRLGMNRYPIYAINAASSLGSYITSFRTEANGPVYALTVAGVGGGALLAGGAFTQIGGEQRLNIASLDKASATVHPWIRYVNNTVRAFAKDGDIVYMGGDFTDIHGDARTRIAALNARTGNITPWNAGGGANNTVRALAVDGDVVYAAGDFSQIGGQDRLRVAALSVSQNSVVASWDANVSPSVLNSVTVGGNSVYLGGTFYSIVGQSRPYFAALSKVEDALPVRWISFEGRLDEQNLAVLDWVTDETNVSHYEVERSRNGRDFNFVATVPAEGNDVSRYRFTDPVAVSGNVYYRIRQVDRDTGPQSAAFSYSRIIGLYTESQAALRVYPNPTLGAVIVELGKEHIGSRARLLSMAGVVLQEVTVKEAVFSIPLDGYPAGMYLLRTEDGEVVKIVKE